MTNYKVVKIGHSKVAEARVHGVYAAAYRFDKLRAYVEQDGSTCEVPFSEVRFLVKLPSREGDERVLWLSPSERQRVLEALQEVDPIGSPQQAQPSLASFGGFCEAGEAA